MNQHDFNYLALADKILRSGTDRQDRTGTGTRGLFGEQLRFDLSRGFPLLTSKKMFWRGIVEELLWIISGSTNVKPLQAKGVHIWDQWADENGELGPVYGAQWRHWDRVVVYDNGIDQLANLINGLKLDPYGRRHIVTAWNPSDAADQKLPPCHCFFQCYVGSDRKLSLHLYQRSADYLLGVPFNIASYSLLTLMLAQVCGYVPGEFIHTFGDVHIYRNHFQQMEEQIRRIPPPAPAVILNPVVDNIDNFTYNDVTLEGYGPLPAIRAAVSV